MDNDHINKLLHLFNESVPIAQCYGMRLSYTEEGNAVIDLPYNPNLNHGLGGIHGGVYATMLDCAGWFTAAASHGESSWVATSEISVHFLLPSKETSLRGLGRLIKSGDRQDIAEMYLYDEENHPVGHATGTFIVLPNIPLP